MTNAKTLDNLLQLWCLGIPCTGHSDLSSLFLNLKFREYFIFLPVSLFICYRSDILIPTSALSQAAEVHVFAV